MRDAYREKAKNMVDGQLKKRGISDPAVLEAFENVPRHLFVPENFKDRAYSDSALPIGEGQTISQPYIVALMSELLKAKRGDKVLEVGTGSGYQAAILAFMGVKLYTIERKGGLLKKAKGSLKKAGFEGVLFKEGDGTLGWEEFSPYSGIIVTAAGKDVPSPLLEQLQENGRLVMPAGDRFSQEMVVYEKNPGGRIVKEKYGGCRFVPLIGKYGW